MCQGDVADGLLSHRLLCCYYLHFAELRSLALGRVNRLRLQRAVVVHHKGSQ